MKGRKDIIRAARGLLQACLNKDGALVPAKAKKVVKRVGEEKPQGYIRILDAFGRMVRIELEKTQAVVSSAVELDAATRSSVEDDLRKKYGTGVDASYIVDADLIGGMKIRVGSDVWDGSLRTRLQKLQDALS